MSDLQYWLGFNLVKGVGPAKLQALINYYDRLEDAWEASEADLRRLGFDQRTIHNLVEGRRTIDLEKRLAEVARAGISLLTWANPQYPSYLRQIPDAPPLFYMRGAITEADHWAVAVVGTRRLTSYGRQTTRQLVEGLVQNGITIVSGLARGIDSIAHQTAVEMGGRTIAVLGSGLDCIYPPENRALAEQIAQNGQGAVLTEYAMGVQPEAKNFPPRNRMISGLSLGTLVIEAGETSGALITADFAMEQGREVFALPGNISSPSSKGTNRLIQKGAKLVMGVEDILEELNISQVVEKVAVRAALPASAEEIALMAHLSAQPIHIDELSRRAALPSSLVSSTLTLMELKGIVHQVGGMNYVRQE